MLRNVKEKRTQIQNQNQNTFKKRANLFEHEQTYFTRSVFTYCEQREKIKELLKTIHELFKCEKRESHGCVRTNRE